MSASEILRKLADIIDQRNSQPAAPMFTPVAADNTDHTDQSVMVSPLQQKQELLKKVAGVDSIYDEPDACEHCGHEPCGCEDNSELDIMKRNAGMPTIVAHIAGEENDIV